mmetsp:Transcript_5640/g.13860  ORF Transcript_5640/g.13860 Transcript_5640/m.13860 type:complete len:144 (-) Transcript_5640:277-708(-)
MWVQFARGHYTDLQAGTTTIPERYGKPSQTLYMKKEFLQDHTLSVPGHVVLMTGTAALQLIPTAIFLFGGRLQLFGLLFLAFLLLFTFFVLRLHHICRQLEHSIMLHGTQPGFLLAKGIGVVPHSKRIEHILPMLTDNTLADH